MSTTASTVTPSYVISNPVTYPNPSQAAFQAGAARRDYQHQLSQVSKGMNGGKNKNRNKKSKKYSRKSAMKKRFSKKFRRSILRKKSRKLRLRKTSLYGGSTVNNGDKLTIPSFRQTSPTGTGIISQLAGNHAQTLAYSAYDDQVTKPSS